MLKWQSSLLCVAVVVACGSVCGVASAADTTDISRSDSARLVLAQAPAQPPMVRPPTAAKTAPPAKNCRREPIWGFRRSVFCKPTGMCSDREIKGYRTVCT